MNLRAAVTFVLAAVALHLLASLPAMSEQMSAAAFLAPAADAAIALAIALFGAAAGRHHLGANAGALLLVLGVLHGVAAVFWPLHRDRQFELADIGELGGLPHYLFGWSPGLVNAALLMLPVLVVAHLVAWCVLARLATAGGRRGTIAWLTVLQVLVLCGAAVPTLWQPAAIGGLASDAGNTALRWIGDRLGGDGAALAPPPGAERMAAAPTDLRGLDGADVHFVILESYGRVALRHDGIAGHLRRLWPELEAELAAAGFAARSGACRPAISGGASLLAHAQLFTGTEVPDFRAWERLLRCGLRPLPRLFADAGYRTVEVLPAMDRHWPEGASFFGFTDQVVQDELGYQGFAYHFGVMPDQYALHHLLRRYVEPAQRPLFSTYVSVTSHLPCTHVPPYVADWQITPTTFAGPPAHSYSTSCFNLRTCPDTAAAYRDAIAYSMRTAVGFAARLTRPSLVVVLGDHQPPIKSILVPSDASYDVPIHVLANRPELLDALAPLGLVPGLDVPDDLVAFDSAAFAPTLLQTFAGR